MNLNNFLCALEILSVFYPVRYNDQSFVVIVYIIKDQLSDNFHHLQLVISSRAILQDEYGGYHVIIVMSYHYSWKHVPVQDSLDSLKTVFFFQLAQGAIDNGDT